eukprot:s2764_g2.t1
MVMRIRRPVPLLAGLLILALLSATTSFAVGRFGRLQTSTPGKTAHAPLTGAPPTLPRPERTVTTRHLFGLGTSELLVILGAAILFFGPETLKGLAKEAGKAAGDLKEVPKAFEEGMSETDKTKPADEEAQEPKKTELKKEEKPESLSSWIGEPPRPQTLGLGTWMQRITGHAVEYSGKVQFGLQGICGSFRK